MVQGVLLAFRRRLTISQVIEFANILPPLLRALFLDDWHPGEGPAPFGTRKELTEEVRSLRAQHNFSPDNALEAFAVALKGSVDARALERVLASLPPQASLFFEVPGMATDSSPSAGGGETDRQ